VSDETHDNCIVLFPGTNATYTGKDASKVIDRFGPGDWIIQQNEISGGGDIMRLAAEKGKGKVVRSPGNKTDLSFPLLL
jgi:ribokinase